MDKRQEIREATALINTAYYPEDISSEGLVTCWAFIKGKGLVQLRYYSLSGEDYIFLFNSQILKVSKFLKLNRSDFEETIRGDLVYIGDHLIIRKPTSHERVNAHLSLEEWIHQKHTSRLQSVDWFN